jgi:iron complex transport system substrate-binding protein
MAARAKVLAIALLLLGAATLEIGSTYAQAPARRIVSIVPAVTEMLFAIGAGPQVAGVSSFDDFPPEVKGLPRVGALLDPDVERILALRPDLVISYGSQTDLQRQLERSRVPVFNYRHAGLPGIFETLQQLGPAVGRKAAADQLIADLRNELARIGRTVQGRRKPRTLLIFERDPGTLRGIYVSGGRGFLHEMLEIAGGVNVFADVAREAVQPSHETLLARAPDVILEVRATGLLTAAETSGEGARVWAPLASIPAVRNERIHFLNGDYLVVPGPRVAMATEAFARALHPDAF